MFYLCFWIYLHICWCQHDFHVRWCSGCSTLPRRASLVVKELLNLPGYPSSLLFLWGSCCSIFCFRVLFCRSLFVLLATVLSGLLRFTDSYYPFRIFKLQIFTEYIILSNKNVDIKFSAHDTFSRMTIHRVRWKSKGLESQIIYKVLGASKPKPKKRA